MPERPTIIGISGSLSMPSRTTALVRAILTRFEQQAETRLLELAAEAPPLFAALPTGPRTERAAAIINAVETTDLWWSDRPSTARPTRAR